MKIITLMPTRGIILTEAQEAVDREMIKNKQVPWFLRVSNMPLPVSRNYLVESALKLPDWTHALLLDDDVIMAEGVLKDLIKLNTDIAVADYPMHYLMDGKHIGTIVRDKDKSIAWAGLGCTFVKREVFEKMPSPWFALTSYRIRRGQDGSVMFFAAQKDGSNNLSAGEDTYFFLQARKLKFKVKSIKKVCKHAHLEQTVSTVHNGRYQTSHKIVTRDKIERELL